MTIDAMLALGGYYVGYVYLGGYFYWLLLLYWLCVAGYGMIM